MLSIVLVEPETSGNVGAIARVMKNFEVKNLILINPKCDHLDGIAMIRSCRAKDILKKAKVKDFSYIDTFDFKIATSAKLGTQYNVSRVPITPDKLPKYINKKIKTALVFGREDRGLSNKEIERCDLFCHIPTSKKYSALNIAQSVGILLYEIFNGKANPELKKYVPATKKEKDVLLKRIGEVLDRLKFTTSVAKSTQEKVWHRVIGKSSLTKREAFSLIGFFKKLK